jgi:hypothetical protein
MAATSEVAMVTVRAVVVTVAATAAMEVMEEAKAAVGMGREERRL